MLLRRPIALVPNVATPVAFVPRPADAVEVLEVAAAKGREGICGVMATVLARHGSAPATPGQKLYCATDGTCVGTVGGGAIEREVLGALSSAIEAVRAGKDAESLFATQTFHLGQELGMCCGGGVDVMIEAITALVPCLVVGGGHVATATAPLLARVGFAVTVVDERDAWGAEGRIAGVKCVVGDYDDVGRDFPKSSVVLVMTHDHALDQKVIEWALKRGFSYVGGVGSRAKAKRTEARLEAKGFSKEDRARVRMPIGVHVGARLPDEIAVAIAAEMVAWRRAVRMTAQVAAP
ncbi:MAG TPA: XdhC family protein [Polyangiaceae bacterium]|nr:XdhC family protein [Polyangiaceae bacterium]